MIANESASCGKPSTCDQLPEVTFLKGNFWRWILRAVGIACIWPYILGWEHPGWRVLAGVVMVLLLLETIGLVRGLRRSAEESREKRPHL